jgi:hypothetical protein
MSAGSILGSVAGFFVGGPAGAAIGAGLGSLAGGNSPGEALKDAAFTGIGGVLGSAVGSFVGGSVGRVSASTIGYVGGSTYGAYTSHRANMLLRQQKEYQKFQNAQIGASLENLRNRSRMASKLAEERARRAFESRGYGIYGSSKRTDNPNARFYASKATLERLQTLVKA